jgi:hypothetical protein
MNANTWQLCVLNGPTSPTTTVRATHPYILRSARFTNVKHYPSHPLTS